MFAGDQLKEVLLLRQKMIETEDVGIGDYTLYSIQ